jgi:hypothetical protein
VNRESTRSRMRAAVRRVALILCAVSLSCGEAEPPTGPDSYGGIDGLIAALQDAGARVDRAGVLPQSSNPFFSVGSTSLRVNGHTVHVWEYRRSAEADAQAALVSPGGFEIGHSMVDWIGPPHFFRSTRLIVLYVGTDEDLLSLLEDVLGPPFAGGSPSCECRGIVP